MRLKSTRPLAGVGDGTQRMTAVNETGFRSPVGRVGLPLLLFYLLSLVYSRCAWLLGQAGPH